MNRSAASVRRTGRFRRSAIQAPQVVRPVRVAELKKILQSESRYNPPFRPLGGNSSATDCTSSTVGTVVDTSALTEIRVVDADRMTVSVQPGVRIADLVKELAEYGLEIGGGHDVMNRTVGGAVAGGCIGPVFGEDGALFASQVTSLKVVTPAGDPVIVRNDQRNLIHAFRLSYGMLGIIYEITLKVRPIRPFNATHRRTTFDQFGGVAEKLAASDVGLKFYLLPFRDRVYLDIRTRADNETATHRIPWKVKDWGESTVLPNLVRSLGRVVPLAGVRYRLIDECSTVTQGLVNNRMVASGSNSTALISHAAASGGKLKYSTWLFPAADFAIVVQAYRDFCLRMQSSTGYRCDLPATGFRIPTDKSALLSPSFDEPMIALRAVTTQTKGWNDFVIDFADFARHWGGTPLFNQTREVPADYPGQVFGSRLEFFRRIRRQFDPENRMMNPFLSQYFL